MSTKTEDTDNIAEETFLSELKSHFEREIDLRKTLDNKANTMITMASSIATLNIAIGTFLLTRIVEKNYFYYSSIVILSLGILFAVISIRRFIQSYGLRDYKYPMGHEYFFENSEYKKDRVENVRNLPENEFNDRLFKGYFESIKTCAELNTNKASGIKGGQKWLTFALIVIAVLVGFVLVSSGLGVITLH